MPKQRNKKVFVTGESGHLGSMICSACRDRGYQVVNDKYLSHAKHSKSKIPDVFSFEYPNEIDILDENLIEKIMQFEDPDIVFHTAAYVGTDKCVSSFHGAYTTNVLATNNLIEIIKENCSNCLFVNFSTTATCDPMYYGYVNRIHENTVRGPKTWYGMTKWQGEQVMKKNYDNWINFLPVFLFGCYPYDTASIWAKIFVKSNNNQKFDILLDCNIYKQYEYAPNMIDIIMSIVENKQSVCKDVVLTGSEINNFGSFLNIAREEYKDIVGKDLQYNIHPERDYLKDHVATPHLMYQLAGITEEQYNKKRIDFRQAIRTVIESCTNVKL